MKVGENDENLAVSLHHGGQECLHGPFEAAFLIINVTVRRMVAIIIRMKMDFPLHESVIFKLHSILSPDFCFLGKASKQKNVFKRALPRWV